MYGLEKKKRVRMHAQLCISGSVNPTIHASPHTATAHSCNRLRQSEECIRFLRVHVCRVVVLFVYSRFLKPCHSSFFSLVIVRGVHSRYQRCSGGRLGSRTIPLTPVSRFAQPGEGLMLGDWGWVSISSYGGINRLIVVTSEKEEKGE